MNKSTLVLGASLNENRYSHACVQALVSGKFPVTAIGLREGKINETPVVTNAPQLSDIHTVTLYLGPENQKTWYRYILELKPQRVIFNPGTENFEFTALLNSAGIESIEDCTIRMIQSGRF